MIWFKDQNQSNVYETSFLDENQNYFIEQVGIQIYLLVDIILFFMKY